MSLAVGYESSYIQVTKIRWVYTCLYELIFLSLFSLSIMIDLNRRNPNKYSTWFVRGMRKYKVAIFSLDALAIFD